MNAQLTDMCLTFASLPSLSSFLISAWIDLSYLSPSASLATPLALQSLFRLSSSSCNSVLRLSRSFEITIRTKEIRKFRMNTSAINCNEVMKVIFWMNWWLEDRIVGARRMNFSHTKCSIRRQSIRRQCWEQEKKKVERKEREHWALYGLTPTYILVAWEQLIRHAYINYSPR